MNASVRQSRSKVCVQPKETGGVATPEYRVKWKKVVRGASRVAADSPEAAAQSLMDRDDEYSFATSLTADDFETVWEDGITVEDVTTV